MSGNEKWIKKWKIHSDFVYIKIETFRFHACRQQGCSDSGDKSRTIHSDSVQPDKSGKVP